MHLSTVAANAALVAAATAACPGVINVNCPQLQKRAIVELGDGQLNSPRRGEAVNQAPDGQLVAEDPLPMEQGRDGQIVVPKAKEETTTVINVVTETIPLEPITRFITITTSLSNNTSNASMATSLAPFANTTMSTSTFESSKIIVPVSSAPPCANTTTETETVQITVLASSNVVVVTQAPFANTTVNEQPTTFQTANTPFFPQSSPIPSNNTCPLTGRCPNLTRNRSGCVFGQNVISMQMVAQMATQQHCVSGMRSASNFEIANMMKGDAQGGCMAYQIGPMMVVNNERVVDSSSGQAIANVGNSNAGMIMVNLLNSSPATFFDQAGSSEQPSFCNDYSIFDHVCDVAGTFPDCTTVAPSSPSNNIESFRGVSFISQSSFGNFSLPAATTTPQGVSATFTQQEAVSTIVRSSVQNSAAEASFGQSTTTSSAQVSPPRASSSIIENSSAVQPTVQSSAGIPSTQRPSICRYIFSCPVLSIH